MHLATQIQHLSTWELEEQTQQTPFFAGLLLSNENPSPPHLSAQAAASTEFGPSWGGSYSPR